MLSLSVAITSILTTSLTYCPANGLKKNAVGGSLSMLSTLLLVGTEA